MKTKIRMGIAQINCTVGDLEGNAEKIMAYISRARAEGVDIVSFPELAVTGYPPEDLLLKADFVTDNLAVLKKITKSVNDIIAVIGYVDRLRKDIYNAAAVIYGGEIKGRYYKMHLPNYSVFDEKRYFREGSEAPIFRAGGITFGVNICEDIWNEGGPVPSQASDGASIVVNISSSPYYAGRIQEREEIIRRQARSNNIFISYANMVGGQDELVFDGYSMIVDRNGKLLARAEAFKEDLLIADLEIPNAGVEAKKYITVSKDLRPGNKAPCAKKEAKLLDTEAEVYEALVLGVRDYAIKNGFTKTLIGLSGGIDSALVAAISADALGGNNTIGVFMPSRYSSSRSEEDAKTLATNLGIKYITISIEQIFKLFLMALEPKFEGQGRGTAEENLQARIRGNLLMALSNKFGYIVLTTGNKSEMSTGYATLYGDMAGGFAVIKDVPKTLVYKLAEYRNGIGRVIPDSILKKEPSAELRPGQKDSDTLPPYDELDKILKMYVEEDKGLDEIAAEGIEKNTVLRVIDMVDKSEYKRRQSPPGIKITPKAFGKDRRMPITNKYKMHQK